MNSLNQVIDLLTATLQIPEKNRLSQNSLLLGAIPEFDSMAVVSVITAIEDHFGLVIEDDEIDAAVFESVGTLVSFVNRKLN